MNSQALDAKKVVDVHCHVGVLGDEYPHWGRMSEWYTHQTVYQVFLIYGRMAAGADGRSILAERRQLHGHQLVNRNDAFG